MKRRLISLGLFTLTIVLVSYVGVGSEKSAERHPPEPNKSEEGNGKKTFKRYYRYSTLC